MAAAAVIAFLVGQRLIELGLSRKNLRIAVSQGGREHFPATFRPIALLHTGFLVSLVVEAGTTVVELTPVKLALLAILIILQIVRYWCIASLGAAWNARIVTVPGAAVCRRGPYRFLRHPNYCVVAVEFLLIPLLLSALWTLMVFFPLNLLILRRRIRLEEQVLAAETDYSHAFGV